MRDDSLSPEGGGKTNPQVTFWRAEEMDTLGQPSEPERHFPEETGPEPPSAELLFLSGFEFDLLRRIATSEAEDLLVLVEEEHRLAAREGELQVSLAGEEPFRLDWSRPGTIHYDDLDLDRINHFGLPMP